MTEPSILPESVNFISFSSKAQSCRGWRCLLSILGEAEDIDKLSMAFSKSYGAKCISDMSVAGEVPFVKTSGEMLVLRGCVSAH